jgi:hypothetical protein
MFFNFRGTNGNSPEYRTSERRIHIEKIFWIRKNLNHFSAADQTLENYTNKSPLKIINYLSFKARGKDGRRSIIV